MLGLEMSIPKLVSLNFVANSKLNESITRYLPGCFNSSTFSETMCLCVYGNGELEASSITILLELN